MTDEPTVQKLFAWVILIGGIFTMMLMGLAYQYLRKKNKERGYRIFWKNSIKIKK